MVAEENVRRTVKDIRQRSVIVRELEDAGDLKVLGAMYDMDTGEVELLD
jgi:carbonic anhydrase